MPSRDVYYKYKHLDYLLSDRQWLPEDLLGDILLDLWMAVREESKREEIVDAQ